MTECTEWFKKRSVRYPVLIFVCEEERCRPGWTSSIAHEAVNHWSLALLPLERLNNANIILCSTCTDSSRWIVTFPGISFAKRKIWALATELLTWVLVISTSWHEMVGYPSELCSVVVYCPLKTIQTGGAASTHTTHAGWRPHKFAELLLSHLISHRMKEAELTKKLT